MARLTDVSNPDGGMAHGPIATSLHAGMMRSFSVSDEEASR